MRHRVLLIGLVTLLAVAASRAADLEPKGLNCVLFAPPNDAGESPDHDFFLRVYPRGSAITKDYSGCQTQWTPQGRGWSKLSVTVIAEGDPVRVWLPARPIDPVNACRYAKGKLVAGDAHVCPSPYFLIPKTLAAGCTAQLKEAEGEAVPGCELE